MRLLRFVVSAFLVASFFGMVLVTTWKRTPNAPTTSKDPALLVWDLRIPPIGEAEGHGSADLAAPFPDWDLVDRFATEQECREELLQLRMFAGSTFPLRQPVFRLRDSPDSTNGYSGCLALRKHFRKALTWLWRKGSAQYHARHGYARELSEIEPPIEGLRRCSIIAFRPDVSKYRNAEIYVTGLGKPEAIGVAPTLSRRGPSQLPIAAVSRPPESSGRPNETLAYDASLVRAPTGLPPDQSGAFPIVRLIAVPANSPQLDRLLRPDNEPTDRWCVGEAVGRTFGSQLIRVQQ